MYHTNMRILPEPTIKYESPYSSASPVYDGQSPSLKRRLSDMATEAKDNDEKRQRIEVPADNDELDLAGIIAQATATAEKTFTDATLRDATYLKPDSTIHASITGQADNGIDAQQTPGLTSGFSSDPQLYMRILSLPMLESLVSSTSPLHTSSKCRGAILI
jgi:protein TBF1